MLSGQELRFSLRNKWEALRGHRSSSKMVNLQHVVMKCTISTATENARDVPAHRRFHRCLADLRVPLSRCIVVKGCRMLRAEVTLRYRVTSACFVPFWLVETTWKTKQYRNTGLCLQWAIMHSDIHEACRWKHRCPHLFERSLHLGSEGRLQLANIPVRFFLTVWTIIKELCWSLGQLWVHNCFKDKPQAQLSGAVDFCELRPDPHYYWQ